MLRDLGPRMRFALRRWGFPQAAPPPKVDLAAWSPPDTRAAREANELLRAVSTPQMVNHCLRTYCFSAILCEQTGGTREVDRETLYVAAALHDVGLFEPSLATEHCFSVTSAREARRIASAAGWDEARQDRVAMAITSNLNSSVSARESGPEAHYLSVGGLVEVIAQEWKVHPDNLAEVLARHPRDGFAADALSHVATETKRHPGGRFACLDPLFPFLVRHSRFSLEARRA